MEQMDSLSCFRVFRDPMFGFHCESPAIFKKTHLILNFVTRLVS